MLAYISHPDCLKHNMGAGHPERPERLTAIDNAIASSELSSLVQYYEAPLVTREQLLRVHDVNYIDTIFKLSPDQGLTYLDPDTAMNPHSLTAALRAAGAVILAVDLVMTDKNKTAFCCIRPPGHHAQRSKAMGFCFFNNVAIGVAHAIEHYKLKQVAIVDFDVHHGNGTEDIFRLEPRVLLCSSFQSPFYPFSGANTKSPHIINLPLPAGTSGKEFRAATTEHWLEKLEAFQPELVFFSAGFDGHKEDNMANFLLTEEDYSWITEKVRAIAQKYCQGRMISVLEGGYALNALGRSVVAHLRAMVGNTLNF
jgi:acetoin utilization deacetylase AcuC-like enzyme